MAAFKFTPFQLAFIKKHFDSMTHKELYAQLLPSRSVRYTTFRTALYANGFKRFNKFKWSDKEIQCLKDNLNIMGNDELAAHITATCGRFIKSKQIDKKLTLLRLTRTPDGFAFIKQKYIDAGVYAAANKKLWEDKVSPEGTTRTWRHHGNPRKVIKVNGTFIHAAPYYWTLKHGPIPAGYVIWHKDGNAANSNPDCKNLEMITRQEAQRRVSIAVHSRPQSLKTAIKLNNKLTKILNDEQRK